MRLLALISATLFFFSVFPAFAIAPPPAQLLDESVTPDCITTNHSYIGGQTPSLGSGGMGTSVRLKNSCTTSITITNISTAKPDAKLAPAPQVDLNVTPSPETHPAKTGRYIFASDAENCREAGERAEKNHQQHVKTRTWQKQEFEKNVAKGGIINPDIQREIESDPHFWDTPRLEEVACGSVAVAVGSTLNVAMPWDTTYEISGHADDKAVVKVTGKMIKPEPMSLPPSVVPSP